MIGGDIVMCLFMFLVSHCATLIIDKVIHDICLVVYDYMKSRSYFVYLYLPHMHLCVC